MRVLVTSVVCLTLALLTASTHAAIIAINPVGTSVISAGGASSQTLSYDATGADKLVVAITAEENGPGPLAVPAVTYNGVALNAAVAANDSSTGQQFAGVFYLDAPASGINDIVVDWGANGEASNGSGFTVVGLTGALAGGPSSTAISQVLGGPLALSPDPDAGSFSIVSFVTNGGADINIAGGSGDGFIQLYNGDVGSADAAGGYELNVGGPTSYTHSGGSTSRPAGVAAAWVEAPEPTSLGLLVIGFIGALANNRRR